MISGALPVLATPFTDDDHVDHGSLTRIVDYVLAAGADGVVFPGVASEFNFLSAEERNAALQVVVATIDGRVPVIVGASAGTAEESGALAAAGAERGARAAMVMAPASVGQDVADLVAFFGEVGERGGLPIILQNAPPPVGSGLSVEVILEAASRVDAIRYFKEETLPCGQRITRLLEGAPESLAGVIGGAGGRYIVDELNRGAGGTMPACELTEAHAAILRAHRAGDRKEARRIYDRILPLLNFQAVFRMAMTKAVLKHRGLITSEHVRAAGPRLDPQDREELSIMLDNVADLLIDPRPSGTG
jgi:4-hydroxy-tetrahydrodipicolinate synthase